MQIIFNKAGTAKAIMFRTHMIAKICTAAMLCSGGEVLAQTIYKQMDANGRTIFTDRPDIASIVVTYEMFPSEERRSESPPRIAPGTRSEVANALFSHTAMTSTYAASVDLNEAGRRLRQARQNRQEGVEARPEERTDGAGASAMERYQRRQQRLEREVVAAERRSQEASLTWSALLRRDGKTDTVKLAQP